MDEVTTLVQSRWFLMLACWSQFSIGFQIGIDDLVIGFYIGPLTIFIGDVGEETDDE